MGGIKLSIDTVSRYYSKWYFDDDFTVQDAINSAKIPYDYDLVGYVTEGHGNLRRLVVFIKEATVSIEDCDEEW